MEEDSSVENATIENMKEPSQLMFVCNDIRELSVSMVVVVFYHVQ